MGVQAATGSDAYDPADVFHFHANYGVAALQRAAGQWWCPATNKLYSLQQVGGAGAGWGWHAPLVAGGRKGRNLPGPSLAALTARAPPRPRPPVQGGCVPQYTQWGYALRGPAYAGIGPAVELDVASPREPGLGLSAEMAGLLTFRGLVPGQAYALHMLTSLAAVPAAPNAAALAGLAPAHTFVAGAAVEQLSVKFQSATPAYFILVAA